MKKRLLNLIQDSIKVFSTFPVWLKVVTLLIALSLIIQTVEGVQSQFSKLMQPTTTVSSSPKPAANPEPVVNPKPVTNPEPAAKELLSKIEQEYNYSRFIDTWGNGTQGLFLPEKAWANLSPEQKQILIDYAKFKSFKAIIVGEQKGKDNISLDRTVWGD